MTKNLNNYKYGAPRKIKRQLGRYYLLMLNIKYQRWFNGLPPINSNVVVLDDNVRKNAESQVDGYEMVYEVFDTPKTDLVLTTGQNTFEEVPPIVNVGDIVLAKGNVFKIHTEPVIYAATRDQIVALLKERSERPEMGGPELEE